MTTPKKENAGEAHTSTEASVPGFLTKEQLHDSANKRIELITKEFSQGFEFLENYPRSVTVFGSSMVKETDSSYQKARSLCKKIVEETKYSVITGGGPGIMEAANRGAFEARGNSLGITIKLPREQNTNSYITDNISLTYFFARKVCLSFSAEAYIFFPGGFGTLDELFEILTLVQTKKIQPVPIILVGSEFWNPLKSFIETQVRDQHMIDPEDMNIFTIHDDEAEIVELIRNAPVRNGITYTHSDHV